LNWVKQNSIRRVRIEEAIDRVLAIVEARVSEKGLTIRKEISGDLPLIRPIGTVWCRFS